MRRALVAAVVSLLVVAGVASAQTSGAPSGPVSDAGRFSLSAEALMWWFKGAPTPPLVTDGLLGRPSTHVLLGGDDVDTNPNPGFRVTAGYALTERWGVEGGVFYVPTRSSSRSVGSSGLIGSRELVIPFFDAIRLGEAVTPLSLPGIHAGQAREEFRTSLLGAELNATTRVPMTGPLRLDALGGFRYLRLRETYTFATDSPDVPPRPADVFQTRDEFDATNNFFGLQLGGRARAEWGAWFLTGALKVALGAMVESVDIDGRLVTNDFNNRGVPQTLAGGYFAQPTNMGRHTRAVFAVVPEAGLTAGYQVTPWMAVVAGYTFLYANNVVHASQQIDRNINPRQAPAISGNLPKPLNGPAEPAFRFNASDFWAQGLNAGLAFGF